MIKCQCCSNSIHVEGEELVVRRELNENVITLLSAMLKNGERFLEIRIKCEKLSDPTVDTTFIGG